MKNRLKRIGKKLPKDREVYSTCWMDEEAGLIRAALANRPEELREIEAGLRKRGCDV